MTNLNIYRVALSYWPLERYGRGNSTSPLTVSPIVKVQLSERVQTHLTADGESHDD